MMTRPRVATMLLMTLAIIEAGCGRAPDDGGFAAQPTQSPEPPATSARAPATSKTWSCATGRRSLALAPVQPVPLPQLAVESGWPAPVVTSMSPLGGAQATVVTIKGSALSSDYFSASTNDYIAIGSGAREMRVCPNTFDRQNEVCTRALSWEPQGISFAVPIGASGDVVVHTKGGSANAGQFVPTWSSSTTYHSAAMTAPTFVLGAYATARRTYAIVVTPLPRDPSGTSSQEPQGAVPTLVVFDATSPMGEVSAVTLEGIAPTSAEEDLPEISFVERASSTEDAVDFVFFANAAGRSGVVHGRVHGNSVDLDGACPDLAARKALALGTNPTSGQLFLWTYVDGHDIAQLDHDDAKSTWTLRREHFGTDIGGKGYVMPDGTVAFGWSLYVGGLFDAKSIAMVSTLKPGQTSFTAQSLTPPRDDYTTIALFPTAGGITAAHCIYDSTGLFDDKGPYGSHCHVEQQAANGEWNPASGWANPMDFGYTFGLVGGSLASADHATGTTYRAGPSGAPIAVIASTAVRSLFAVRFPDGVLATPRLVVTTGLGAAVLRPQ